MPASSGCPRAGRAPAARSPLQEQGRGTWSPSAAGAPTGRRSTTGRTCGCAGRRGATRFRIRSYQDPLRSGGCVVRQEELLEARGRRGHARGAGAREGRENGRHGVVVGLERRAAVLGDEVMYPVQPGQDGEVGHRGRQPRTVKAVSYTHLTLPTNREV